MAISSRAAYRIVKLDGIAPEIVAELKDDAQVGGGLYGLKVVEEAVNGASRTPIYGVYFGDDEEKLRESLARLKVVDGKVIDMTEEEEEEARAEASEHADAVAAKQRAKEDAEVSAVTGDADKGTTDAKPADAKPNKAK